MTGVARILVVINLLLAVGFLFSAATILSLNKHYKDLWERSEAEKVQQKEASDRQIAKVTAERNDAQRSARDLKEEVANLRGTNSTQKTHISSLESEKKSLETSRNQLQTTLDSLQATVKRHGEYVERLTKESKDNADDARKARAEAKDARDALTAERKKNTDLENDKANLQKDVTAKVELIKQKDVMIDFARSKGINFENLVVMDPVKGNVVNADNDSMLAVVNIGASNGVKKGYVLDVTRGSSYIARVEIDTVYDKASAGTIKFLAPGETVRAGDQVTNTLN